MSARTPWRLHAGAGWGLTCVGLARGVQKPERVAGLAFLDPVVFMLNLKDILYNFLYR